MRLCTRIKGGTRIFHTGFVTLTYMSSQALPGGFCMFHPKLLLLIFMLLLGSFAVPPHAEGGLSQKYTKTVETYAAPDVTLVDQTGSKVRLRELLKAKKVTMMDFIFTTCTTICPVLSAGFSNFQRKMGADAKDFQLLSISIDPENDTPQKLKEYSARYHAKPGWEFLTGSREDIEKVVKAFDAYTSNKMNHLPLALLHDPAGGKWIRIYGLIGTSDLIAEFEKVRKQ